MQNEYIFILLALLTTNMWLYCIWSRLGGMIQMLSAYRSMDTALYQQKSMHEKKLEELATRKPRAQYNKVTIDRLRHMNASGVSCKDIAIREKMPYTTVWCIVKGRKK